MRDGVNKWRRIVAVRSILLTDYKCYRRAVMTLFP